MHRIHITREQAKKLAKGGSINISLEQIHNPRSDKHNHVLEFDTNKKLHDHKGFRLRSEDIHGGTISLDDEFKKPIAKSIMQKASEKIINSIPNNVLGKNQKQSANILASNLINNNNQKQTISTINGLGFHEHEHHEMYHEHHHHEKGKGIRNGLIKGSEQAKEHMRKLRELKSDKGGTLKSITNAVKGSAKQEWNNDKQAGKAIFLNKNVPPALIASIASGQPEIVGSVIGANAINYGISKYSGKQTNLVSSKNVGDAYKAQQKSNGGGVEKRKRGRPRKHHEEVMRAGNIIPIGSGLYY